MPGPSIPDLDELLREGAVKLEITAGIPTWEPAPNSRHQQTVYRIQTSIKPCPENDDKCKCTHLSDVLTRFQDGSLKRPDIASSALSLPYRTRL